MAKRKTPQKIHLEMLDSKAKPACITGRGPLTSDPDKVTCKGCRGSGTMSRLLMRRMRAKTLER